ncbi:hypothetical protein [Streptomyces sp. NPDC087270]|uniref:hypothetical protein n=1 Tax=Streptomyces sp. NPDC087270 TaxID=3365774 RepID=UPI00382FDE53
MPMPDALRNDLSETRHASLALRRLLRELGADEALLRRVVPRSDERGADYVHIPPLPLDVAQHLIRLLPTPPAPTPPAPMPHP